MDERNKTFSILYKGRDTSKEGDLIYINHSDWTPISIFMSDLSED